MEELKKVSLKVDAPPQVDVQEKKSIFMDIGTIMNLMFPMLGMNLFLIYGMKSEQNQAGIYVYSGLVYGSDVSGMFYFMAYDFRKV